MDVFLVPVGPERYELYCEVADEPEAPQSEPPEGRLRRLKHRFTEMLAEAERERRHGRDRAPEGWIQRVKAMVMRWVAESVAEQRLLWTLRRQTHAAFFYPDDIDEARAVELLRKQLKRDFDKHQFWLIIDSIGFVLSGLLMLVPGPNLLAYYFAFRMVGHYFSLRGARQGLGRIAWTNQSSPPLSQLRRAIDMAPEQRQQRVRDVAEQLRLEDLPTFFQRTAIPSP